MVSDGKPRVSNPPYVPLPPPTSSHVCITPLIPGSVDLIALAGLAGFITSDSSSPKTIKDQAPIAYSKIKSCLTAAGATPRDMVQMKHYTARETGDPEQDKLDIADGHKSPDTVVGVASLAVTGLLYECEVWAVARK
ncbi:unnamed protein product [Diplocarpon coronariae]